MTPTDEQIAIFSHDPTVHACILAGPGTGKSSTIIEYLAGVCKIDPDKVVRLLTFTRAANLELMDKVTEGGHGITTSTIHAFSISILLANPGTSGLPEPIRIGDTWEWEELIRRWLARRLGLKVRVVEKLKQEMSAQWEALAPEYDETIPEEMRARFMGAWEEHRTVFGYSLLAELPFRLKTALEAEPSLDLGGIHLLAVDEYQDLNACDLACIRLLSQRGTTIVALGDDDQSIYGFRKAHPIGIRHFSADFSAPSYPLSISHRCGKYILRLANFVITGDPERPGKPELKPGPNNNDGETAFLVFNREDSEAKGVVRLIDYLHRKHEVPLEEILVLVRTKNIAKYIQETLEAADIKFCNPEIVLEQLGDHESRSLLSILRLLVHREDSLAWWTILTLVDGIGPSTIDAIYTLTLASKRTFGKQIHECGQNSFAGITHGNRLAEEYRNTLALLEDIEVPSSEEWGKWIITLIEQKKLPQAPDVVKELFLKMDEWETGVQQSLGRFINKIEPLAKDILNSKTPGYVRIMSLSRSKGLTVRAAIIAAAENGILPHPLADRQEERRLLYVGMSRARDFLFITRARRRIGQTARVGVANVIRSRTACPFLDGGPVSQQDGDTFLRQFGL